MICPEKYSALITALGMSEVKLAHLWDIVTFSKHSKLSETGDGRILDLISCDENYCAKYNKCFGEFDPSLMSKTWNDKGQSNVE